MTFLKKKITVYVYLLHRFKLYVPVPFLKLLLLAIRGHYAETGSL